MPAPFITLHVDFTREESVWRIQSVELQASPGILNILEFLVRFVPSNT